MKTLDQHITSSLDVIRDAVHKAGGRVIPSDELYPLFMGALPDRGSGMHVLDSGVHLMLGHDIPCQRARKSFMPADFLSKTDRDIFLETSGLADQGIPALITETLFPLHSTITLNGIHANDVTGAIFLGGEVQLRFPGAERDEDRFLTMVRDQGSAHAKGGLFAPGMTLARSPVVCSILPLNEKTGMLVKKDDTFYLLFFKNSDGVTGITAGEKLSRIPKLLERISATYGAVPGLAPDKIKLLDVELLPDPEMEAFKVPLVVRYNDGSGSREETSYHTMQYVPGIQALSPLTMLVMPDTVAGTRQQDLVDGENLFLADIFKDYNRSIFLATPAELKYAHSFADSSNGWSQNGAMMPGLAWRAQQYPELAPAHDVYLREDGKMVRMTYSKGDKDNFVLAPAAASGPAPKTDPAL